MRLPPGAIHHRHVIRSPPTLLQELGRQRKISLYVCFVDLQKAYDSVCRELLLWKVLARAGVPSVMIDVIRQFHDGMRASVRLDDGELSEWFEITQGLRQGYALSPMLFNIFAAVMDVVLQRFSEDGIILEDLVFLDEGRGGRPDETLLDRVWRAVWGMLHADDDGIVSRSPARLARIMAVIVEVFCAFGLTMSGKKTENLLMRAPEKTQQPGETPTPPLPALEIAAADQKYNQAHQL